jgi:hypothetical protein
MGGIEWYRHFLAIPGVSSFDKISRNVIPLPDSGFLYAGSTLDFMFGTYEGSTFHRLDRFGNIISAKGPIFNWFFLYLLAFPVDGVFILNIKIWK